MSQPSDTPTARKLRAQLAATSNALAEANQTITDLHAQLTRANAAAVRMANLHAVPGTPSTSELA